MSKAQRMMVGTAAKRAAAAAFIGVMMAGCAAAPMPDAAAPTGPLTESALGSYLAARHAQQIRDYAHAATFMNRALGDDPANFDLLRRAFVLRVSDGQIADAVPLARRIVAHDPGAELAEVVLLLQEAKAGDFKAAAARAEALPSEGAQRLTASLLLAWCDMGLGRPAPALAALNGLDQVHGLQTLKDLHTALLADYADRRDEADAAYKKVLGAQNPPTWRTAELAGNFYERHQRAREARRLYERLAATDQGAEIVAGALARIDHGEIPKRIVASPRDGLAEALFDLASILDRADTLDASLIYGRLALDLRPGFPLAQMLIADIDEEQQHIADALAVYRAIDAKSALGWTARLRAAAALDALGRTDEAVAELGRMATERPGAPEPLVELGDILRGRSRFADAVAAYDQAIARVRHPGPHDWRLFYSRAVALERSGNWPRAEADLKHALVLEPDQPLALNYLGYSWIDKGENLEPALKMLERAVSLRPNDGYVVDSLGWAYYRLGRFSKATSLLERAIELLPEDPTINDHLGDAYWQDGRLVEARYQWRRALQFKPDAGEMKAIETKLDRGIAKPPTAAARGG